MTADQQKRLDFIISIMNEDDSEEKHGYMYESFVLDLLHYLKQEQEKPSLLQKLLKQSHIKLGGFIYLIDGDNILQLEKEGLKPTRIFETYKLLEQHLEKTII